MAVTNILSWSLKTRLLILVTVVMVAGLIVGGFFILQNAREAVKAEIHSSVKLVESMIKRSLTMGVLEDNLSELTGNIEGLRHVKVITEYRYLSPTDKETLKIEGIPNWFTNLVYPKGELPLKIILHGKSSHNIVITADPVDEIREVWEDAGDMLMLYLSLFFISLILIYAVVWHGLKPLDELKFGFEQLEQGNLSIRIDEHVIPDLARIHRRFNHTVSVLKKTTREKENLARKMVTLQEDERNYLARELHDEIGPYLFNIRITCSGIRQLDLPPEKYKAEVETRLKDIDQIVEKLQERVRTLLKKLRPMVLNDLDLCSALYDLVSMFKASNSGIEWNLTCKLKEDLDDTIKVTVYRIVQECLTNIGRHSKARYASVNLFLQEEDEQKHVHLIVEDDGIGLQKNRKSGYGLIGIHERVQALGGTVWINSDPTDRTRKGTRIKIILPIEKEQS